MIINNQIQIPMLNSNYLVDDLVLATLLKKSDSNSLAWKLTFRVYQLAFMNILKLNEHVSEKRIQAIFENTFTTLINNLKAPSFTITKTLFASLLAIARKNHNCTLSENQMKSTAPYMSGEILVNLIRANEAQCIYHLFNHYKEPTISILNYKYDKYFNVSPDEIYGEAIMILKNNIEKGKLQAPMKSRLFTYFFLIARNKYLALGNQMKGLTFYPDFMELETALSLANPAPARNTAFDDLCPILKKLLDNSNKEFFKNLLHTFHSDEHELLKLRFEEGLRFREIGKRMNLKEATCRKRLHDSIKKWKKQYFVKQFA